MEWDETDDWLKIVKAKSPMNMEARISDVHLRGWQVAKFGVEVDPKHSEEVKDWLFTTLRAEEKREKEGLQVEEGLKLKGVWPRIMVQKSPEAKARWARLFNFKDEIDDRLHHFAHSMVPDPTELECYIVFARFSLCICSPSPKGPSWTPRGTTARSTGGGRSRSGRSRSG